ncbi:MAG: class I SAM-dependent methyltransferase [Rubrivivax sp.]|nr:class I SAM-dependent methyltransferase [Pyrinomonadaceae bacterium]
MNIREHNRRAWDAEVERGNEWTVPVSRQRIEDARQGRWSIRLSEQKPAPREWFPEELRGLEVLCLASGGGQQAPIISAMGARVTVLDNSPGQLAQDRAVAEREKLDLKTVEGDMADLSVFADESFDLIYHPVSNLFVPAVRPVWHEAFRVLRRGGVMLAGFLNPAFYIFDQELAERGILEVKHALPYSDTDSLSETERARRVAEREVFEFSHTLTDLIGGQLDAGFLLTGLYEDHHRTQLQAKYMPTYIATRAIKP